MGFQGDEYPTHITLWYITYKYLKNAKNKGHKIFCTNKYVQTKEPKYKKKKILNLLTC